MGFNPLKFAAKALKVAGPIGNIVADFAPDLAGGLLKGVIGTDFGLSKINDGKELSIDEIKVNTVKALGKRFLGKEDFNPEELYEKITNASPTEFDKLKEKAQEMDHEFRMKELEVKQREQNLEAYKGEKEERSDIRNLMMGNKDFFLQQQRMGYIIVVLFVGMFLSVLLIGILNASDSIALTLDEFTKQTIFLFSGAVIGYMAKVIDVNFGGRANLDSKDSAENVINEAVSNKQGVL